MGRYITLNLPEEVRGAHPICVLKKMAEGLDKVTAARQCISEGKLHGIHKLVRQLAGRV